MFQILIQGFFANMMVFWVLFFLCPVYIALAKLICRAIQLFYISSLDRRSTIYQYIGDIKWLFPFNTKEAEFKLEHIILVSIMLALLSLLVVSTMICSSYSGQQNEELRNKMIKQLQKEGYELSAEKQEKNKKNK